MPMPNWLRRHRSDAGSAAALTLIVAVACLARLIWHTNADTSWLLDVAERTLKGATPYRDIAEVNPPASFLMYIPAVWLANAVGLEPETATNILVFFGAFLSLAVSGRILMRARLIDRAGAGWLVGWSLVVLLVVPLASFAQREHIVVLAILPVLACLAARLSGERPSLVDVVLAGAGAGVAVSVKPVFALALLGPCFMLGVRRSWRQALGAGEVWIACGLTIVYGLAVIIVWPEYGSHIVPLATMVYLPARLPLMQLLLLPNLWICAAMLWAFWRSGSDATGIGSVAALSSLGFAACILIQGKGFTYHTYPAVALAILAVCAARVGPAGRADERASIHAAIAVATSLCVFADWDDLQDRTRLKTEIAAIAPHPRLLTISGDGYLGRVFARQVGGEWVGSAPTPWVTCFAFLITPTFEKDSRFIEAIRMEQDRYAADIASGRPDVIVIDGEGWLRWAHNSPDLVRAMAGYRHVGQDGPLSLWSTVPSATSLRPGLGSAPDGAIVPKGFSGLGSSFRTADGAAGQTE